MAPLLCVHVTWVSYFISYESAPGRLSPIVTVILALINTIMRIQDLGNQSMDSTTIFEAYVMTCLFQVGFLQMQEKSQVKKVIHFLGAYSIVRILVYSYKD